MTPSLRRDIVDAGLRVIVAREQLLRLFAVAFPRGERVAVKLCVHQVRPTPGTVTGWWGDGRIGVRLDTTNRRGRKTIKQVHWSRVFPS